VQMSWWRLEIYLLDRFWCSELNGAGELGESVYGEKADDSPPVGEGIIGLFNAIAYVFGLEAQVWSRWSARM
jgi:hypothetical protein